MEATTVRVDELTIDELEDTEDEVLRMLKTLGLDSKDQSRMAILTKRKFREMRDVLRFRALVKKGTKLG
jgi:hypothetical protein